MSSNYKFTFARAGGFDQVMIESGADVLAIPELDQKLWLALACPTRGIEFDERTLDIVDHDKDGRIRAPEIKEAINWMGSVLHDPDQLMKGSSSLPLSAISPGKDNGKQVLASAKQILRNLGKGDSKSITIEDVTDTAAIFAETQFNGDGIVPASAAGTEELTKAMEEMIACVGGETDRSGADGLSNEKVEAFFAAAQAYADWHAQSDGTTEALGDDTEKAVTAFQAVKAKIDDYFTRCSLAAFDPRAAEHMSRDAAGWADIAANTLTSGDEAIAQFPLAAVAPGQALPLGAGLNPAWAGAMDTFVNDAVQPLLGRQIKMTEKQWAEISGKLAGYDAWLSAKAGTEVENLGIERVQQLLADDTRSAVEALIEKDEALRAEAEGIEAVEKTVRLNRDLVELLKNFVSFENFYGKKAPAVFQAGTLYLDGRSCDLVMTVTDAGKHAKLAGLSQAYLAYCDCVRPETGEKRQIVAAFTDGDTDFLMVGRNGVYYDRDGNDWDATIAKVVDNPLSIRQAFWSPYKRVAKMISAQVEKFAASKEKAAQGRMDGAVNKGTATAKTATTAGAPKPQPTAFDVGKFAGIFAAVGLALGFIGSAVVAMASGFMALKVWQMPLAIAGLMLLISGPSMLMAWLKLRQRNLAPLLDASGWAINARARINVPFGASLTDVAALPSNANRRMEDPFAEKKSPWRILVPAAIVVGIVATVLVQNGVLQSWLGM